MLYLSQFNMPTRQDEEGYSRGIRYNCFNSYYPFGVFPNRELPILNFEPVSFFYGGNGSGKSTLLNVIADKLCLERGAIYNRSNFFDDYVKLCSFATPGDKPVPEGSRIITSDDVFDYLLDVRCINSGIDLKRAELLDEYMDYRHSDYQLKSLDDYDQWRRHADAKSKKPNVSKYVRQHLMRNVQERSNGESALFYFTDAIKENALYLLDEPENSLSAALQLELVKFIESSVRFFGCQFIISTHSPFLLSMKGSKVYDLDATPPRQKNWTELENVKTYQEFFKSHEAEFE